MTAGTVPRGALHDVSCCGSARRESHGGAVLIEDSAERPVDVAAWHGHDIRQFLAGSNRLPLANMHIMVHQNRRPNAGRYSQRWQHVAGQRTVSGVDERSTYSRRSHKAAQQAVCGAFDADQQKALRSVNFASNKALVACIVSPDTGNSQRCAEAEAARTFEDVQVEGGVLEIALNEGLDVHQSCTQTHNQLMHTDVTHG